MAALLSLRAKGLIGLERAGGGEGVGGRKEDEGKGLKAGGSLKIKERAKEMQNAEGVEGRN